MQVTSTNDVKIYNLSAGKSLPDWLTERKKRQLVKSDIDVRKRIELIQDFEMPAVSDRVKVSKDGQYVLATGIYKPRLRCYDLNNLGMKFERCLDSEVRPTAATSRANLVLRWSSSACSAMTTPRWCSSTVTATSSCTRRPAATTGSGAGTATVTVCHGRI
jgi:hypothetical protein